MPWERGRTKREMNINIFKGVIKGRKTPKFPNVGREIRDIFIKLSPLETHREGGRLSG